MSTSDQPSRREFLQGRARIGADGDSQTPLTPPQDSAPEAAAALLTPQERGVLVSLRRAAMACEFEVQMPAGGEDDSVERVLEAFDLVESLETQMTVYRSDSELIHINGQAGRRAVAVEPRLFELLQVAERLYHETDGALDITSGPLSEIWGFSRREGRLPTDAEIAAVLARVGMNHVRLEAAEMRVSFLRPGIALNLNSIGKGYALDRMAELLNDGGVGDYLLHGGRSSVLARGSCPRLPSSDETSPRDDRPAAGWTIGVRHPLRPELRLAEFDLLNEALGTSGAATQFFHHRGKRYGHLIDPTTGWPATEVHSATVIAPTAAEADALSTAFYVMGPDRVGEYCDAHPDVVAVLVCPAERGTDVELLTFGLAEDRWRRLTDR